MKLKSSPVISNTAYQLLAKAIAVGFTLLTTTYIIRLGGSSLFGEYTKAIALIAIGFTAIDFGLNAQAIRRMSVSTKHNHQVLIDTFVARFFLAILSLIILNLLVFILPQTYSSQFKSSFWLGSLAIVFQGIFTSANVWFQYQLNYWRSSLAIILASLTTTSLTLYFLHFSPSITHLLLAFVSGYFIMAGVSILLLRPLPPLKLSLSSSFKHLRQSLWLGAILIVSVFASKADIVILGVLQNSNVVGQYGLAYRVFDVAIVLPIFVMNVVYPLLVKASLVAEKHRLVNKSIKYLFFLGVLGSLVLYPLAPLIDLIKPELSLSITTFKILILFLPLFYVSAPIMWQLIEAGLEKYLFFLYLISAIFNAGLNLLFVPIFGAITSAVLTGVTEFIILIGLLYFKRYLITPTTKH